MSLDAVETRRKLVHIGMGFFALFLRRLDWREAALAALAALAFNLFVLPRVGGGRLLREEDLTRGYPIGILLYPIVVLVLIVIFRKHLELAAAGWGLLAFGDGFATLVGGGLEGPRLPWNPRKTWAGLLAYVVFGSLGSGLLFAFVRGRGFTRGECVVVVLGAIAGAIVESLPSEIDDNLLPPLVGAAVITCLLPAIPASNYFVTASFLEKLAIGAAINLGVALLGAVLKIVRPSGAVAGFVLGTIVFAFGGREFYAILWIFFVVGTVATRFGRKRKEAMGKAEPDEGRRGAANVLANVTVPTFCVIVGASRPMSHPNVFDLAAAAAFATALMDTVGTEVGQAIRTRTVLLPDFKSVPTGTDGAVSIAGTLAGVFAAVFVAVVALDLHRVTQRGAFLVVVAALAGTVAESLLGRAGEPWRVSNGHVLNFYNTLVGATVALALVP